ncbi:MAG: thymidine phosphorylase, partial [Myxococcota bacterium]
MRIEDLLLNMGRGVPQSDAAIQAFIDGVVDGSVSRPQAAAWLAFAFARTLTPAETVALTRAMTQSGSVMTWEEGPTLIDKHST